jgi:hypothetical protein
MKAGWMKADSCTLTARSPSSTFQMLSGPEASYRPGLARAPVCWIWLSAPLNPVARLSLRDLRFEISSLIRENCPQPEAIRTRETSRIAQQITLAFGVDIDKDMVRHLGRR